MKKSAEMAETQNGTALQDKGKKTKTGNISLKGATGLNYRRNK